MILCFVFTFTIIRVDLGVWFGFGFSLIPAFGFWCLVLFGLFVFCLFVGLRFGWFCVSCLCVLDWVYLCDFDLGIVWFGLFECSGLRLVMLILFDTD